MARNGPLPALTRPRPDRTRAASARSPPQLASSSFVADVPPRVDALLTASPPSLSLSVSAPPAGAFLGGPLRCVRRRRHACSNRGGRRHGSCVGHHDRWAGCHLPPHALHSRHPATGDRLHALSHEAGASVLAVDIWGDFLLVGCTDGRCFYWQLSTERLKVRPQRTYTRTPPPLATVPCASRGPDPFPARCRSLLRPCIRSERSLGTATRRRRCSSLRGDSGLCVWPHRDAGPGWPPHI